jgi:hypothetical protein
MNTHRSQTAVCTEKPIRIEPVRELHHVGGVIALILLALKLLAAHIKSKSRLEAENAVLRHQLIVLRRKVHGRVQLSNADRLFFVQLYRGLPSILKLISIVRPETLVRWHCEGFRRYWPGSHARWEDGHRSARSCGP